MTDELKLEELTQDAREFIEMYNQLTPENKLKCIEKIRELSQEKEGKE